jgi:ketosteroid isomerase-like protein
VYSSLRPGHPIRRAIAQRVGSRSYAAFNRNDLDALLPLYDSACLWDWSHFAGWPDDPVFRGPDGLRRGWLFFREAWGDFEVELSEVRDCGDQVMCTCHMRATGEGSGVGLETTWWQVVEFRDGLITLVANYTDRREALEAAGLPSTALQVPQ